MRVSCEQRGGEAGKWAQVGVCEKRREKVGREGGEVGMGEGVKAGKAQVYSVCRDSSWEVGRVRR